MNWGEMENKINNRIACSAVFEPLLQQPQEENLQFPLYSIPPSTQEVTKKI